MNIFNIPQVNPLKPYVQTDYKGNEKIVNTIEFVKPAFNKSYSRQSIDTDFYARNLNTWMAKVGYVKPYLSSDRLTMTWTGLDVLPISGLIPYVVNIVDCEGDVYQSITPSVEALVATGERIYKINHSVHLIPNGIYFLQIQQIGYAPNFDSFVITEPFEIRDEWQDTVLIEYRNTSNAQGVFFDEIDMLFCTRIHGSLIDIATNSNYNVYENQTRDLTMLSGTPYRDWTLNIGVKNKKIPEYILDQLERISVCDTVYIDGKEYTRNEGAKWEKLPLEGYPLFEAKLSVREKINDQDLSVTLYPLKFMDMPETDIFYIKEINYAFGTTTVLSYFTHRTRLLAYFNNVYLGATGNQTDSYFTINENDELILHTKDDTLWNILYLFPPTAVQIAPYHLKIKPEPSGTFFISFTNLSSVNYAYFDKSDLVALGTSTGSVEVVNFYDKWDKYLFWVDADTIAFTASSPIFKVGGNLPTSLTSLDLSGLNLKEVYNNLFATASAITTVTMQNNQLSTNEVNKIIKYIYESLSNFATATVDIDLQNPIAPPTHDSAVSYFIDTIASQITLNTD